MIRSFYELKILTSLCDEEIEKYSHRLDRNGKYKINSNHKLEIRKGKTIDQLFAYINEYRKNINESRIERRLYFKSFEELESKYSEKFRQHLNFSLDQFVVRINALKAKYEKLKAINADNLANQEFYKLIDDSVAIESSAFDLLEQMNIYICSSDKLQPLHIIDLYYSMADYFHNANSISTKYKYTLAKRLKPDLTEALQNFNFTLAKELLAKIKELR